MYDHQDRKAMVESGDYPDHKTGTDSEWLAWANANYPFDPKWEKHLLKRQPHQREVPGDKRELNDLRGIRDRGMAAFLARLWFYLGTPEYERAFEEEERHKKAMAAREARQRQAANPVVEQPMNNRRARAQNWQEDER